MSRCFAVEGKGRGSVNKVKGRADMEGRRGGAQNRRAMGGYGRGGGIGGR